MPENQQRQRRNGALPVRWSAMLHLRKMAGARSIVSRLLPAWAEIKASVGIKT
jgi:hypothetical protein